MNFAKWEPVYETILEDFGYDRERDAQARDLLADLVEGETVEPHEIASGDQSLEGQTVAIAGAGPSLSSETDIVRDADFVFAASTAVDTLADVGITVDSMVTDLDKNPETARELTGNGTAVAVHAHGDNVAALRKYLPEFDHTAVLPTTQARPVDPVYNTGGFTDGDRAAFLADHLGAERLVFPGWDLDDETVGAEKQRKLRWAERLLYWLEQIRGERFLVLDGRRDEIDTTALPM